MTDDPDGTTLDELAFKLIETSLGLVHGGTDYRAAVMAQLHAITALLDQEPDPVLAIGSVAHMAAVTVAQMCKEGIEAGVDPAVIGRATRGMLRDRPDAGDAGDADAAELDGLGEAIAAVPGLLIASRNSDAEAQEILATQMVSAIGPVTAVAVNAKIAAMMFEAVCRQHNRGDSDDEWDVERMLLTYAQDAVTTWQDRLREDG